MVLADSDGFLNCPAEIAARKVQVHLLRGDFALAKKIIDDFAHEIRQDRGDAVVDWTHDQRLINTLANLGIHTLSQLRQRLPTLRKNLPPQCSHGFVRQCERLLLNYDSAYQNSGYQP